MEDGQFPKGSIREYVMRGQRCKITNQVSGLREF